MRPLGWYTVVFNVLIILLLALTASGVIPPAPFSWPESGAWIVLTLPVVWLGIRVLRDYY